MLSDLRYALRQLVKSPGFALVALLTLSLGIGVSTAVFTLANAILLRSLPVPNPQELRVLHWSGTNVRIVSLDSQYYEKVGDRVTAESFSYPMFKEMRAQSAPQADVFGYYPLENITVRIGSSAISSNGMMVSENFFHALGVQTGTGRLFSVDTVGNPETGIVITHGLWKRHFGSDPSVLGRTVSMQGQAYTIIGVLPRDFPGIQPGAPREFYIILSTQSPFLVQDQSPTRHWWVRMMARLKPGVSDAQAKVILSGILSQGSADALSDSYMVVKPGGNGLGFDRDTYGKPIALMLAVAGLVMLVACANLAGLLLSRGAARRHELALRAALGAGRWRLVRQSLAESLLLSCIGGAIGVLFAAWARTGLSHLLAPTTEGLRYDLSLDTPVLVFNITVTMLTAFLLGILPAWSAGRTNPLSGIKSRHSHATPQLRAGRVLVIAQVCLSLSVLAIAGLFLHSLIKLRLINAGFETTNLLLFQLKPDAGDYRGDGLISYYTNVQEKLSAIPGVASVTLMDRPLLADSGNTGEVKLDNLPPRSTWTEHVTQRLSVSETFFSTMGIGIIEGRGFSTADDQNAPKVIVVNETFAREFLPGVDAIGHTISMCGAEWRIVGVCHDARILNIKKAPPPTTYFPARQRFYGGFKDFTVNSACFAIRSSLEPSTLADAVRKTVAACDPNVPVTDLVSQDQRLRANVQRENFLAVLCGALAALALLLSCIGLYGLMSYHVVRRTNEIGIRMAIGAQRHDIAQAILLEALRLIGIGIALGLPSAWLVTRLIESQLYAVSPHDPLILIGGALLMLGVGVLAAWLPVRHATRIDPIEALRAE